MFLTMQRAFDRLSEVISPVFLKKLNRWLMVLSFVLSAVLVVSGLFSNFGRQRTPTGPTKPDAESPRASFFKNDETLPAYSVYAEMIGQKTFFGASTARVRSGAPQEGAKAVAGLTLVGIVPGENAQAIVEDAGSRKTFYLRQGQTQEGMTVKEISGNTVVLEYGGETRTLTL